MVGTEFVNGDYIFPNKKNYVRDNASTNEKGAQYTGSVCAQMERFKKSGAH